MHAGVTLSEQQNHSASYVNFHIDHSNLSSTSFGNQQSKSYYLIRSHSYNRIFRAVCIKLTWVAGGGSSSLTLRFELLAFIVLFNFKKKNSLRKNKASENPFNISKNQELELFLLCHFKNLISPKPIEQSVESYFTEKIKVIVSTAHALVCPYFSFILKKKIFLRKSKPGHGLVQYFNLNDNFDDVRTNFFNF